MTGPVVDDDVRDGAPSRPGPRPWTPEAAMEPVPPLAPPPARPGAGTPVPIAPREPRHRHPAVFALELVAIVALLAVLVVLVIHAGG